MMVYCKLIINMDIYDRMVHDCWQTEQEEKRVYEKQTNFDARAASGGAGVLDRMHS